MCRRLCRGCGSDCAARAGAFNPDVLQHIHTNPELKKLLYKETTTLSDILHGIQIKDRA